LVTVALAPVCYLAGAYIRTKIHAKASTGA
jgi:hypothetical protein